MTDPVWSKVISAGIIAVLVGAWAYLSGYSCLYGLVLACLDIRHIILVSAKLGVGFGNTYQNYSADVAT